MSPQGAFRTQCQWKGGSPCLKLHHMTNQLLTMSYYTVYSKVLIIWGYKKVKREIFCLIPKIKNSHSNAGLSYFEIPNY